MEKLLQLLNEYDKDSMRTEKSVYAHETRVISKKFWFIERLIANDKLDKEWLFNIIRESCIFDDMNICSESDYIIMYLAIGYNPIYFLTSMVK